MSHRLDHYIFDDVNRGKFLIRRHVDTCGNQTTTAAVVVAVL